MKHFDIDFDEVDFADELIRQIEKDYGRSVARIPFFERTSPNTFNIKIIFTDFRLLDAEIKVIPFMSYMPQIIVEGVYF